MPATFPDTACLEAVRRNPRYANCSDREKYRIALIDTMIRDVNADLDLAFAHPYNWRKIEN
jgi:hypothetical protein